MGLEVTELVVHGRHGGGHRHSEANDGENLERPATSMSANLVAPFLHFGFCLSTLPKLLCDKFYQIYRGSHRSTTVLGTLVDLLCAIITSGVTPKFELTGVTRSR